jgi:tetraacyldisaccharide 4'-kinase
LAAAVARHLRERGLNVTILSRGYRGRGRGVRVVSAGEGPLLGPLVAGDEPVQLAGELPGVAVIVGPDRYRAGLHALERLPKPPDIFLLEDGFSHLKLYRDLDLLTFPAVDPFAGGRLWPAGGLREPMASVRHADAAVLTGATVPLGSQLAESLALHGFEGSAFVSRTAVLAPRIERDRELPDNARVLVVTGIAREERVLASIAQLPCLIVGTLHFPDHHSYPAATLQEIDRYRTEVGADWVLTTSKDHVKLLGRLESPLAFLPVRARPETAFWQWLDSKLEQPA